MQSFTEDLNKVMGVINYRGALIYPVENNKFRVLYKDYDSLEQAKRKIDLMWTILDKMTTIK